MEIHKIETTDPNDVNRFIRVPFDLYRDCPLWVPPLVAGMRAALNRESYFFYKHSKADFFIVHDGGPPLGRIAVLENRRFNEYHGSKTAFFYYFDVVDDTRAATELFSAAFDWAGARGLTRVMGPKGLMRFDAHGVLVKGYEHRPSVGIPYNWPYYERLIEAAGFQKELDYHSGYLSREYELSDRMITLAEKVKRRRKFWIKAFRSKREMWSFLPRAHRIYLEAFKQVPGYYPVSEEEMKLMLERVISVTYPNLVKVVMRAEEPVGFLITYPDVGDALKKSNGRMWPLGWYHVMRERARTKWVTFHGVGILPEYQGLGANIMLYAELQDTMVASRFDYADYVQVADTNLQHFGEINELQVPMYKTHRVYSKEL